MNLGCPVLEMKAVWIYRRVYSSILEKYKICLKKLLYVVCITSDKDMVINGGLHNTAHNIRKNTMITRWEVQMVCQYLTRISYVRNYYLGEGNTLFCPDWYCKVASSIDSAITSLFSISARDPVASSYFSCIVIVNHEISNVLAIYFLSFQLHHQRKKSHWRNFLVPNRLNKQASNCRHIVIP